CDPTGGQIGFWLHGARKTESPPIVLVGSEGELEVLSNSLEEFLTQLAAGNTHAPDLDSRDAGGDEGRELYEWLRSRAIASRGQGNPDRPDLKQWMEKWGQEQRTHIDNDVFHVQIAEKLRKYVEPKARQWETANFDVLLVGSQFRMWHRSYGPKSMPQYE